MAKHTIVTLVEDKPGVLNRVSSLFRRRGFNIESIAVGHAEIPGVSRMTIVVDGSAVSVEQVRKQLDKLVNVIRITDITDSSLVARELALIKVRSTPGTRGEIIEIVDIYRAKIVDVSMDSIVVEVTGDEDKIESLMRLLKGYGIREVARTGRIAMQRGIAAPSVSEQKAHTRPARAKKAAEPEA